MIKKITYNIKGTRSKTFRYINTKTGKFASAGDYDRYQAEKEIKKYQSSLTSKALEIVDDEIEIPEPPESVITKIGKDGKKYYFDERGKFLPKIYRPDFRAPDVQTPYWTADGAANDLNPDKIIIVLRNKNGRIVQRKTMNRNAGIKELQTFTRNENKRQRDGNYFVVSYDIDIRNNAMTYYIDIVDKETFTKRHGDRV